MEISFFFVIYEDVCQNSWETSSVIIFFFSLLTLSLLSPGLKKHIVTRMFLGRLYRVFECCKVCPGDRHLEQAAAGQFCALCHFSPQDLLQGTHVSIFSPRCLKVGAQDQR